MLNLGSLAGKGVRKGAPASYWLHTRSRAGEDGFELSVDQDIGIATNGRCEVGVQGLIEGVVTVFGDIQHPCAEIRGGLHGLPKKRFKHFAGGRILYSLQRSLDCASRGYVHSDASPGATLGECRQTPLERFLVSSEQGLFWKLIGDRLGDGQVRQQHELGFDVGRSTTRKTRKARTSSTSLLASDDISGPQSTGVPFSSSTNFNLTSSMANIPFATRLWRSLVASR